jgi:ketosteroid isomerase-like protein
VGSLGIAEKEALLGELYDAFNRGDIDQAIAQLHPKVEVRLAMDPIEPVAGSRREIRGPDGVREFFDLLDTSWERATVEIKRVVEGKENRAIAFETWSVRGLQGIEIDTELVDVYGFRDGLIASCDGFRDKNEALAAFGLDS